MRTWILQFNPLHVTRAPKGRRTSFFGPHRHQFQYSHIHTTVLVAASERSSAVVDDEDNDEDVEVLLRKAANLVSTSNTLLPYDSREINLALVIWKAIRDVPESQRAQLVGLLNSVSIRRLWLVSGERYAALPSLVANTVGPDYSLWADLPDSPDKLVHFSGKAALPLHFLQWNNFGASFFLHPETEDPFGRLAVLLPPVRDVLYPLYCSVSVGQDIVPGIEELCDMVLRFLPAQALGLAPEAVPRSAWPRPRDPLPPFNQGLTAYMRAAGPGLLVGKALQTRKAGLGQPVYFVAAKEREELLV